MEFGILGPLRLWDGQVEVSVRGSTQRKLLALLLVHRGEVLTADRVIENLWAAALPQDPSNALQSAVSKLRRLLGESAQVLRTEATGYVLDISADQLDATRFEAGVGAGRKALTTGDPVEASAVLEQALALWRGRILADFADCDFARLEAIRLEEIRLAAEEDWFEAELRQGHHAEVVGQLGSFVEQHPLRERPCGQLMVALYRCGRQADALRAYQAARHTLADELGLEPGPELRRIEAAVLAEDPALELHAHAAPARPRRRTNIGAPLNNFVGRADELAALRDLVLRHRLVTAIGTGGVGKTRLAVELAAQLVSQLRDGAWLVDLAPLSDGSAVTAAIAQALDLPELGTVSAAEGSLPLVDRLVDFLTNKHMLVVIDNCDHLLGDVASVAATMLGACPSLTILATSREALGVPGEVVWSVPPMDLHDAVELFAARADASQPGISLSDDFEPAGTEICRRLDGLPLAIELAAVRVRAMSVNELASRLDDRFRLLTGGARTAMPRQRTLRAVVDWSYELLFEGERTLFDRLSVFANGCSLDAAEDVCAGGPLAASHMVDLLARLIDKSLLVADTSDDETRYRLLQSLALYGRERLLATGEDRDVRDVHSQYFEKLCARSDGAWQGHDQRRWLRQVAAEWSDIHAAFEWALRRGHAERATAMAGALGWYWWLTGRVVEGCDCLSQALSAPGEVSPATRARALCWAGQLMGDLGLSEEAVTLYRGTDDREGLAQATMLFGSTLSARGDLVRAEEILTDAFREYGHLEGEPAAATRMAVAAHLMLLRGDRQGAEARLHECVDAYSAVGDEWATAICLEAIADLAEQRNDPLHAAASLRTAGGIARELGLWGFEAGVLARLGTLAAADENWDEADRLHREALQLSQELGFRAGVALALNGLAFSQRSRGQLNGAVACAEGALEIYETADLAGGAAAALGTLGFAAEQRRDANAARRLHLSGFEQARRVPGPLPMAVALAGLAGAAAAGSDGKVAGLLLGAAERLRQSSPWPPPSRPADIDRTSATASALIGPEAFEQAVVRGGSTAVDDLLKRVTEADGLPAHS